MDLRYRKTSVIGTLADVHALWQSEFTLCIKLIMRQDFVPSDS